MTCPRCMKNVTPNLNGRCPLYFGLLPPRRLPFITLNRPQRGGAHDGEALVLDVIDKQYEENRIGFRLRCLQAIDAGHTLEEYVTEQVHAALRHMAGVSLARKRLAGILAVRGADVVIPPDPPAYVEVTVS